MRFIKLFLVGYVVMVLGIGLALWQTGVLGRLAPIWIGVGILLAVGVGIMLSVSSGKPTITSETPR
jgi:integral membrane sensor domain MASE1